MSRESKISFNYDSNWKEYQCLTSNQKKIEIPKLIGGISGDTKIYLVDNRNITIFELIGESNLGINNFCFSLNNNYNIVITRIKEPIELGEASKLIKIILDNNETIYCDFNCNFITRDKKIVNAISLINNQSLMPLITTFAENVPINQRSYRDKRMKLNDYLVVYNPNTNLYDYIHFLADDYNLRNFIYNNDNGEIRHHNDFNKYNNNPTNIKRIEWKEHFNIHSDFSKERAIKGEIGWGRAHELHPEFYSEMASENMKKLHQDPEFQKRHLNRVTPRFGEYVKSPEFFEMTREAGERGKNYLIEYNKSEKGREKSSEIALDGKMECQICEKVVYGRAEMNQHYKEEHPDNWEQHQVKFQKASLDYLRSEEGRKNQSERARYGKMECQICGEVVHGASELRHHYAEKHNEPIKCPYCGNFFKGKGGLSTHIKFCPKKITNHKIIDIRIIDSQPTMIYTIKLENFQSFGLSSGVFIHSE